MDLFTCRLVNYITAPAACAAVARYLPEVSSAVSLGGLTCQGAAVAGLGISALARQCEVRLPDMGLKNIYAKMTRDHILAGTAVFVVSLVAAQIGLIAAPLSLGAMAAMTGVTLAIKMLTQSCANTAPSVRNRQKFDYLQDQPPGTVLGKVPTEITA